MAERFASIDVGTNTVLLLVAERGDDGGLRAIVERMELTRLGRGVDATRRLHPEAISETVETIRDFAETARAAGASGIVLTATSAARDAENGDEFFVRAQEASGVPVEILPGDAEAQLSYESARRDFASEAGLVVMDVGGGSTEFVYGSGEDVSFRRSLDVGAVRLTERWLRSDPPAPAELQALRAELKALLSTLPPPPPGAKLVGVAGTVTTLCALRLGLSSYDGAKVHGQRLGASAVRRLADELAALDLRGRLALPGLPPKRADVIVAGAEIVATSMEILGFDELLVSDRGVRWGLLHQRFGRPTA